MDESSTRLSRSRLGARDESDEAARNERTDLEALLRAALPFEDGPEVTTEELRGWIGEELERIADLDDLLVVWTVVGALRDPTAIRVVDAELELVARFQEKLEGRRSA